MNHDTQDLVGRLREHADRVAGGSCGEPTYDPETLSLEHEAADEVSRLRAALDACHKVIVTAQAAQPNHLTKTVDYPVISKKEIDLGWWGKMQTVLIPPGEFMMGSNEDAGDETPAHKVRITKPFYMGVTPVTQSQYLAVTGENPSHFDGANNPVERVSWNDATEFCRKVSQMAGVEVRLPTEAEWEYACRAGTTTRFCFGDSDNDLSDYAWYLDNSGEKTRPVGQKKPNAWGLYDMHGNVWEWCQDRYDSGYYREGGKDDPTGPQNGGRRVLRGGSWYDDASFCRAAFRFSGTPTGTCYNFGFRVVVRDF